MKWIASIAVCVALVPAAWAQANEAAAEESENELLTKLREPISLEAADAYIGGVLEQISELQGINVVLDSRSVAPQDADDADPDIEYASDGIVVFAKFDSVPLDSVLEALLKPLGLGYSVQPEFIWVTTPERVQHESFERLEQRVYKLNGPYVVAANAEPGQETENRIRITKVLDFFVPDVIDPSTGEALSAYIYNPETKQLLVQQVPTNLKKVEQLLELIETES